ncbi:GDSL-type esterase/lipase family protein [Streptomyces sp. Tue6028]|uniref:golvesin C-terminal-like domain-containing protein n=1 Tax=Streptomyces sp. Tue6028 TaxID=2036037 RepID=UPI003EB9E4DE
MKLRTARKRWVVVLTSALTVGLLPSAYALAAPQAPGDGGASAGKAPNTAARTAGTAADPSGPSKVADPDRTLPKGWRTSDDRAVTVAGDARGLHVLVADSADAYQWQEAATLREDGFDADAWIGNVCVTGSGKRAVVAYAPRTFTNTSALFDRGAFAAVVDLGTHKVTKLPQQVSLAYFNPGCGTGETAVLTQSADEEVGKTRLLRLNTVTGKVSGTVTVRGEATSAVPVGDATVAALGNRLTRITGSGSTQLIGRTSGPAFRLHPDADGGVGFLDRHGNDVAVRRAAGGKVTELAHGALGKVGLSAGTGGRLFLTGKPQGVAQLPSGIRRLEAEAGTEVSSHGRLVIGRAVSTGLRSHVTSPLAATGDDSPLPFTVEARVPATDKKVDFTVPPDTSTGAGQHSPALRTAAAGGTTKQALAATAAASSTTTSDPERTCAVPRNDESQQALQPTPNQVEWAADMAIRGNLTSGYITQGGWRSADGLGSSVSPSTMFPVPALKGAASGSRIPAQVLLGILAQESNLWQASYHALPGQTGNALIGNFYGTNIYPGTTGYDPTKIWSIDWAKADCGYGIGQQTDGMSVATRQQPGKPGALPADQQRAIALDYAANIAVAAQTLAKKWNELHTDGQTIKINDDDPKYIENWFAAAWNYNLGYNTPDSSGKWGLGWLNNPANPKYPADRFAFLDNNHYADAAQPQKWPYPEKVMGWAAFPIDTGRSYSDAGVQDSGNTHGFQAAWWGNAGARTRVKPSLDTFCNGSNGCDSGNPPQCTTEDCYKQYWYHANASWKTTCSLECGNETLTYKTLRAELGRGNSGQPNCSTSGLPSGARIVDDVAAGVPTMRTDCSKTWSNAGTMSWDFADTPGTVTTYEGKEDFHQVGGGFGAHFWFAHTRNSANRISQMKVTGTWTLTQRLDQWARVMVHLPSTGSESQQARYDITLGDGTTRHRTINQVTSKNEWYPLGTYHFVNGSKPQSVALSNAAGDGTADDDVAWDAVAFVPLSAKPKDFVVAMGDSFSSGEGAGSYAPESDMDYGKRTWNACHRSANAWSRKAVLPGRSSSVGALADANDPTLDYQFVACSGAYTDNALGKYSAGRDDQTAPWGWGNDGEFGEIPQLGSGVLSADTTLVTISIGGNDARFSPLAAACAATDCSDSGYTYKSDPKPLTEYEPEFIANSVGPWVSETLTEIRAQAPNAKIVLMGYPRLFSPTACAVEYNDREVAIFNSWADKLATVMKQSATSFGDPKIVYTNPQYKFEGHAFCDGPHYINPIQMSPNGPGDFQEAAMPSRGSIHPNDLGTTAYAQVLEDALNGTLH